MSLDFDGVNDVVTSDATQTLGTTVTLAGWMNNDTQGESDAGRMYMHGNTGAERMAFSWNGTAASKIWTFVAAWSTSAGGFAIWSTAALSVITGWKWMAVTYDYGATGNNPIMYTLEGNTLSTLTVGSGLTETVSPSGSASADNKTLRIGNDQATGTTFDGRLGELAIWKRILTAEEIAAVARLGVNAAPDHFNYLPLDPTAQNLGSSGTTFTITGAVAGENPPIRGAGRKG